MSGFVTLTDEQFGQLVAGNAIVLAAIGNVVNTEVAAMVGPAVAAAVGPAVTSSVASNLASSLGPAITSALTATLPSAIASALPGADLSSSVVIVNGLRTTLHDISNMIYSAVQPATMAANLLAIGAPDKVATLNDFVSHLPNEFNGNGGALALRSDGFLQELPI